MQAKAVLYEVRTAVAVEMQHQRRLPLSTSTTRSTS